MYIWIVTIASLGNSANLGGLRRVEDVLNKVMMGVALVVEWVVVGDDEEADDAMRDETGGFGGNAVF